MTLNESSGLLEAVEAGELASVQLLLDQGADTEVTDENGLRSLHSAAFWGYRDIVGALVAAGADVDARDRFERTALHHAIVGAHIAAGAKLDARDRFEKTALHHASVVGHSAIVIYLLLHGADPEARYHVGLSAFELAAVTCHQQTAALLELASRADLQYVRRLALSVATPPSYPSESADRLMVTMLLKEKNINIEFEPLVSAFLQEIRTEPPKRTGPPPTRSSERARADQDLPVPQSPNSRKTVRFTGVPPESIGTRTSWVIGGSDESVNSEEVNMLEEAAHISTIMNKTVMELNKIAIDNSTNALDLFNDCYRQMGGDSEKDFYRTFTATHRAALMLYTDDRFFRVLNTYWRSHRSREMLGFSTLMSIAFRHAKYFIEGEVYRGVDLADVDHYQRGLVFRWPFFVSASKNRNIAAGFGKTLVTIEVPASANVRDIAYCSLYPEEEEVLFRAYEVFEVIEANLNGIRIRIFYDENFGTGWEITEQGQLREIK